MKLSTGEIDGKGHVRRMMMREPEADFWCSQLRLRGAEQQGGMACAL